MSKTIGIDLGTTNSVVAFKDTTVKVVSTGPNNEDLCRSCVAMDPSGSFVVGNAPFKNWKKYAPNIVVSAKRLMGGSISDPEVLKMKADKTSYPYGITKLSGGTDESVAIVMQGKQFTPEQISAEVLRQLKKDAEVKLGDQVTHAVITVPAYFNEKQKAATRKAAELAGLKVQRLLAEPTAAAISYGADKMSADEGKIFLVYDFGGGTFDLSILVASGGNFIESGTGGDRWLGGDDIDRLVSDYVLQQVSDKYEVDVKQIIESLSEKKKYAFQGEFKTEIENAKKALSQSDSYTISVYDSLETEDIDPIDIEVCIKRAQFENLIRPLVQRTLDLIDILLEKTQYPIDTIDNILLVGGSSCIPLVRQMLSDKYGKEKILSSEKPMLAIAEGAAILSHSMGTEVECPNCGQVIPVGSDECPHCHASVAGAVSSNVQDGGVSVSFTTKHKYFIETVDEAENADYQLIIGDNEVLPNEVSKKFFTLLENQKIVTVKLFSDAENNSKQLIGIGFLSLQDNLPAHSPLQFTFRLTEDELLCVRVKIVATGKSQDVIISRGNKDEHCLIEINKTMVEVMNNLDVADYKKSEFFSKIQEVIDGISASAIPSDSAKWTEFENAVKLARSLSLVKDEHNNEGEANIAKFLLNIFEQYIRPEDVVALERELKNFDRASSPMEKNEIANKLHEITVHYGLLLNGGMFAIVAENASDPDLAQKAKSVFSQFMSALHAHDISRANNILDSNVHLLNSFAQAGSGFTTAFTTSLGRSDV
ncbi:MAG: Hsp70 family protein [Bacteroidales bacterium]|nr:Hsp70 family protein [Bacteroidales bacterium]